MLNVLERELADLQGADLDACLPPPHRDKTFPLYNLEPKKGIKDIGKKKIKHVTLSILEVERDLS